MQLIDGFGASWSPPLISESWNPCGPVAGHLLDDGALTEDVGVEPGRLIGVAVAPDGGSDELVHVNTVA